MPERTTAALTPWRLALATAGLIWLVFGTAVVVLVYFMTPGASFSDALATALPPERVYLIVASVLWFAALMRGVQPYTFDRSGALLLVGVPLVANVFLLAHWWSTPLACATDVYGCARYNARVPTLLFAVPSAVLVAAQYLHSRRSPQPVLSISRRLAVVAMMAPLLALSGWAEYRAAGVLVDHRIEQVNAGRP